MNLQEIDAIAKTSMSDSGFREYLKYKESLICDGEPESEIVQILTGYIWDETEGK